MPELTTMVKLGFTRSLPKEPEMSNAVQFTEDQQSAIYRGTSTGQLVNWHSERQSLAQHVSDKARGYNDRMIGLIEAELGRRGFTLVNSADTHELAHRENERRWAVEQTADLSVDDFSGEDVAEIRELAQITIRHWRLAREAREWTAKGRHQTRRSSMAAQELAAEYGLEVRGSSSGWILATDH